MMMDKTCLKSACAGPNYAQNGLIMTVIDDDGEDLQEVFLCMVGKT
jgi:hypothetical protein